MEGIEEGCSAEAVQIWSRGIRILALNRNEEKHGFAPSRKKTTVLIVDRHGAIPPIPLFIVSSS